MGDFSHLIRQAIDGSIHSFTTLSEEIRYLKTYVKVENIRFDNKISLKIETNNLDIDNVIIPNMLIQPLIENTIAQSIESVNKQLKINISFSKEENYTKCYVNDNGITSDMNNEKKDSVFYTVQTVKERLSLLQGYKKEKLITISTSYKGTVITLFIKNQKNT